MSNTPALQRNHDLKDNRNTTIARFAVHESTSFSLETDTTSKNHASEGTTDTSVSLETDDASEKHAQSITRLL